MIQFQSVTAIWLTLLALAGNCAAQPDLRSIQHRFVEMAVSAERLHIRNSAQWQNFWNRFTPATPPNIDFRSSDVIVVLMGTQGSAGFSIHINDVESNALGTKVRLLVCRPPKGLAQVTEVTSPYDVKVTPKLALPIDWITVDGQTGSSPCA